MDNLNTLIAQLQAILKEICRANSRENGLWCDQVSKAMGLVNDIEVAATGKPDVNNSLSCLETSAVNLWNFSMALKTRGGLSLLSNAKLRQISFHLLCIYTHSLEIEDENVLRKKTMMGLKTARAWLDSGEMDRAIQVLEKTDQFIKNVQKYVIELINQNGNSEVLQKRRLDIDMDIFRMLCYKAEAAVAQSRHQEALDMALLAKEMLSNFPKEGAFLAMLCYNSGVELYQKKAYEESVTWLRESFELGKGQVKIGSKNQARTLRLLASAYLDWDCEEHADKILNAVSLANVENPHPAGFYLRLKVLLQMQEPVAVLSKAIDDILKQPDMSLEIGLNTVGLVAQYKRYSVAIDLMKELLKRYENSQDIGKLLTANFDILLDSNNMEELKEFIEYCITGHNTGKPLEPTVKRKFHIVFWEQADSAFKSKKYEEALEWYNYSFSLYARHETGDKNLSKLQRNRASCYYSMGQIGHAAQIMQEAEKYDPDSVYTQFMLYKLAIADSNTDRATEALQKMCNCAINNEDNLDDTIPDLICVAAQMAFEGNYQRTAAVALECLANCSPDHMQVLTSLRCLIRLKLASLDQDADISIQKSGLLDNIRTAKNRILQMLDLENDLPKLYNEANWFMKIAWNVALKCEDHPYMMKELFCLCSQLSGICPPDEGCLNRQKTCMLMASAGCLQLARSTVNNEIWVQSLEEALCHIDNCRKFQQQLQQDSLTMLESKSKDTTETLLLMYEFEARVKLKDPTVEHVLEKVLKLPNPDPKVFETIAALSVEPPAENKSISVRALKVAIRKHLQILSPDFEKCSKLFHSLIQLALSGGIDLSGKEEARKYYDEVIDVISNKAQPGQYPEIEVLWLMTKAWNCGVSFYSAGRYDDAERWCTISMKLLKYLGAMRENYEEHMNKIYSDVLDKMERSKMRSGSRNQEE